MAGFFAQVVLAVVFALVGYYARGAVERRRQGAANVSAGGGGGDAEVKAQLLGELDAEANVNTYTVRRRGGTWCTLDKRETMTPRAASVETPRTFTGATSSQPMASSTCTERGSPEPANPIADPPRPPYSVQGNYPSWSGQAAPRSNESPLYVNAKQFHRILKRRLARQVLEERLRAMSSARESAHLREPTGNAMMRRPRGPNGRFLTVEEMDKMRDAESVGGSSGAD